MADQLDFILCSIVKFPNHQWPLTMPESLLSIIPRRVNELPTPVTLLHQFVELNAKMIPHSPALEYVASIESGKLKKRVWSYEQLNLEGSKIEQFLQSEGIRANNLVGICFEKCPEASFAILGILKAGCGYVALDPGAPPARKQYIIRDSGCQIVLTAQRSEGWLSGVGGKDDIHPVRIVYVDELHVKLEDGLKTPSPVLPTDLCYCLYTSGTTGNPKGCEITHENAVQAMRAFSIQFNKRWNPTSKWLQFASFHFDVSILEQFWSWSEGICVVSAPRDLMLLDLPGFIRKLEITHLDLTPSLATLLKPEEVPSLCKGVFITGGEALRQDILNAWGRMEVIHNGYGPTEATIGVTMYPRVPANGKPSNIGKQFDNVGAYVLEPGTEIPVLKGAIGELCVSGKLVGRGYLNNAQLSSHKFPTLISFKERVYRTGDLVRLLCDGSFEFLGRSDDQVKLRGQRLEIGEIDSVIKDVTGVSGVSTFILRHPKQQKKQLVAFFTLESTPNAKELSVISTNEHLQKISQISENCKSRLPPYMVPTYFIPVSVLPLTANNKVDRNKLRRLYDSFSINELHNLIAQRASAEGLNTFEENVAHTLSRSLKMEVGSISPNSSLFELGLDSISVIRFVRVLHQSGFKGASISLVMNSRFKMTD
jgi:amino acid adenylation domain-containing protein